MSHKNKRLFEKAHESPNRQVGCFHFGLLERGRRLPVIPQPAGWGYFIPAYSAGEHTNRKWTEPLCVG